MTQSFKVLSVWSLLAGAVLVAVVPMVGCGSEEGGGTVVQPISPARPSPSDAADAYQVASVEQGATLRGTIRYSGTPPQRTALTVDHDLETCAQQEIRSEDLIVAPDGKVQNAVVWLEGIEEGKPWPEGESTLDQQGCSYRPHVVAVGVGQPIQFANADAVKHNVKTFARENPPLNVTLLGAGAGRPVTRTFRLADEIKVGCDSHKWMSAWIIVRDSPYFAITGEGGEFTIGDVPSGTYKMVVWHESLERLEKTVELATGETRIEDVELKSR